MEAGRSRGIGFGGENGRIWGAASCGVTESVAQQPQRSIRPQHEAVEIGRKLRMTIEREHIRDVLVRPHDDHAAAARSMPRRSKDVVAALQVGAEHLFVVAKPVTSLRRAAATAACVSMREFAMRLLEHRTDIDH